MPERCQLAQFSSVERLLEQTYGSSCGGPALGMAPNSPRRRAPGWPPRRVAAPRLEMTRQGVLSSNGSTCASARAARGGWDGRRVRGTHATSRSRLTRLETHGVGSGNPRASGGRRATRRCQHICRRSECQAMEREKNHGNAPRVRALFLLNQAAPGAAPVKATSASSSRRSRPNGAREQAESRTREAHSHGPITAPDKCQRQAEMASERAVAPTSKNTNGPALLSCVCGCLLTGAIIGLVCSRVPSAECERCAQWIPDTIEPGTRVVGGVLGPDTIHREAGNRRETPT